MDYTTEITQEYARANEGVKNQNERKCHCFILNFIRDPGKLLVNTWVFPDICSCAILRMCYPLIPPLSFSEFRTET